jgi:FKBP-type peptidyl-prolyl cis-trans isomerase FkpA
MKTKLRLIIASAIILSLVSCDKVDFKKTKSGLVYKIISGGNKDSAARNGNVVKFYFTRKFNDSVLYSSFGKMPSYVPLQADPNMNYSPVEVFYFAKKGDSIVTVEMVDTLIKKGLQAQLPPNAKNGDKMTTYIKIIEIFKSDSTAMPDYQAEMAKDKPRQEKEQAEMQAKAQAQQLETMKKEWDELKKSGEMDKQIKAMETFLAAKSIKAQKTEIGTFVVVNQKGSGATPVDGKFVTVKYTGKILETDSVFESSQYTFQMGAHVGPNAVIRGWDDGLKSFNVGGKGILYIPAYLAYGKQAGPGGKTNQPLTFDVEVLNVSDTKEQPAPTPPAVDTTQRK